MAVQYYVEMCIRLFWQWAALVKVFIVGFYFPVCWHCFLLCSVDIRILWLGFFAFPVFRGWRLFLANQPMKGWVLSVTLKWLERCHAVPVCGWMHVHASCHQLRFPAAPSPDMGQPWLPGAAELRWGCCGWSFSAPVVQMGDAKTVSWLFSTGQQSWSVCFPGGLQNSKIGHQISLI